jgi:hypothetical protein
MQGIRKPKFQACHILAWENLKLICVCEHLDQFLTICHLVPIRVVDMSAIWFISVEFDERTSGKGSVGPQLLLGAWIE